MKATLFAMLVALLMVGCGEDGKSGSDSPESNQSTAEPLDAKTAQVEEIDLDDPETRKKITAEAIFYFQLRKLEKEGPELWYAPNQQTPYSGWAKMYHGRKKEQVRMLRQYREGKLDGPYVSWWKNGQKMLDATFKNGKTMTMVMWKPNGEKCPVTNVMNGNGVQVWYHDDGTEERRVTFKDGYRSYPSALSSDNLSVPAPTNSLEELLADIENALTKTAMPHGGSEVAKIDLNASGTPDDLPPIDGMLKEVDEILRNLDQSLGTKDGSGNTPQSVASEVDPEAMVRGVAKAFAAKDYEAFRKFTCLGMGKDEFKQFMAKNDDRKVVRTWNPVRDDFQEELIVEMQKAYAEILQESLEKGFDWSQAKVVECEQDDDVKAKLRSGNVELYLHLDDCFMTPKGLLTFDAPRARARELAATNSAEPPPKTVEVAKIDLDDNETRNRIAAEAIDFNLLAQRPSTGLLFYAPNQQTAYTGWAKSMHDNGRVRVLSQFQDGKGDGLVNHWYSSGQKAVELTLQANKPMTAVVWKPNGDKCPVTNVKDGNGVALWYNDDGTEGGRHIYKDGENIEPFGGLEVLAKIRGAKESNATKLNLNSSNITDLTPLAELTNLNWLWLNDNKITDLSPLAGLMNLEYLYLDGNQITNIAALAGLTNLKVLGLAQSQITDISPLTGLTKLEVLWAPKNQISDLTPLKGLTKLWKLWLGGNQITDLSQLKGLTKLGWLHLQGNQITDLTPLKGLKDLNELTLRQNQITDLSPLARLPKLGWLHLNGNPIPNAQAFMIKKALPNCKVDF